MRRPTDGPDPVFDPEAQTRREGPGFRTCQAGLGATADTEVGRYETGVFRQSLALRSIRRVLFRGLEFADAVQDFRMFRKSAGFLLAVDQLAVGFDVEDSPAALDEFGGDVEFGLDRVRQTGGLRRVVSLYAILNGNVHVGPLIRRSLFAYTLFAHTCPLSFI